MLDFTELPDDGTAFEQLLREMFLRYGTPVHWTGQGPDDGRDLIVVDTMIGRFGNAERKWLVQCKHNAHSGKAVGRKDVAGVIDDCAQVGATGYLLACSTVPSSGVVTKLRELHESSDNDIVTQVWDHVEIERRLDDPRLFSLAQIFFPESTKATKWRLYNAGLPNKWTANYNGCFVILICRVGGEPPPLSDCAAIIDGLRSMEKKKEGEPWWEQEEVRPRLLFWDDKFTQFRAYADYILPSGNASPLQTPQDFADRLNNGMAWEANGEYVSPCTFYVRPVRASKGSDRYHCDDPDYYKRCENGAPTGETSVGELAEFGNQWR